MELGRFIYSEVWDNIFTKMQSYEATKDVRVKSSHLVRREVFHGVQTLIRIQSEDNVLEPIELKDL